MFAARRKDHFLKQLIASRLFREAEVFRERNGGINGIDSINPNIQEPTYFFQGIASQVRFYAEIRSSHLGSHAFQRIQDPVQSQSRVETSVSLGSTFPQARLGIIERVIGHHNVAYI